MFSTNHPESYTIKECINGFYKVLFTDNVKEVATGYLYDEIPYMIKGSSESEIIQVLSIEYDAYFAAAKENWDYTQTKCKIQNYTSRLNASDYKMMKCIESFMLGNSFPYNLSELLSDRIELRDEINALTSKESESVTIDDLKSRKITEMSAANQVIITNGIDLNGKHYRLNTTDQINLTSLYALAQKGNSVPYHADGEVCKVFSADEMIELVESATQWVIYHTTYFNLLKHQILSMKDEESIEAVTYGTALIPEYQAIIDELTSNK